MVYSLNHCVLDVRHFSGMMKEERMHATIYTQADLETEDTKNIVDRDLLTELKDEMKVWVYLMM